MKKIIPLVFTCLALLITNIYAGSRTYNANCTLAVDGKTYMNGKCFYKSYKDSDEFDDLRTKAICPNGLNYEDPRMNCSMAELKILSNGIFGTLDRNPNGTASFCWNTGGGMHAQDCYEGLTRNGACWSSNAAKSPYRKGSTRIELCAWK